MSLQVNLLDQSEVRSTSRVSKRFLIQGGSILAVFAVLGFVGTLLFKQNSLSRQSRELNEQWEEMRPRKAKVDALLKDLRWREGVMGELQGWKEAATNWHEELDQLAAVVPRNMQFVSMEVSGPVHTRRVKDAPSTFSRQYKVDLVGIAQGQDADDKVLQFIRKLPETKAIEQHWESGTLKKIQNQFSGKGNNAVQRRFELEIRFKSREW